MSELRDELRAYIEDSMALGYPAPDSAYDFLALLDAGPIFEHKRGAVDLREVSAIGRSNLFPGDTMFGVMLNVHGAYSECAMTQSEYDTLVIRWKHTRGTA